jgi:hypothetical protein
MGGLSMGNIFGGGGDQTHSGLGFGKPGFGLGGAPNDPFHTGASMSTPLGGPNSMVNQYGPGASVGAGAVFGGPLALLGLGGLGALGNHLNFGDYFKGRGNVAGYYLQHPGQIVPGAYDILSGQEQPLQTYNRNKAYAQSQSQAGANAGRSYAGARGLTGGTGVGVANEAAQGPLQQWLNSQAGMSGGDDFMNMLMQLMTMSGYGGG